MCSICHISPAGPAPDLVMSMTLCRVLIEDDCIHNMEHLLSNKIISLLALLRPADMLEMHKVSFSSH